MSGQSSFDHNTNSNYPDNNGPRRVYVHHINEDPTPNNHHHSMGYAPQQQYQYAPHPPPLPPQPMFIPMPMPIPQPQPIPMFMGGGCGYGYPHSQMQPPVIIINGSGDQTTSDGGGGGGGGDASPSDDKEEEEEDRNDSSTSTSPFHPISFVSIIFFVIASILGFICVAKIYDVFESSMNANTTDNNNNNSNNYYENDQDLDEHILDYLVVHRTVALGMGAASILMFSIAFLLSFYAGMRYRLQSKKKKKSKPKNCCLGGLLIAAWILFCLTFINGLIILVLAFDEEARIYPEVALSAVIGNMASWICMFGYSQLARRS